MQVNASRPSAFRVKFSSQCYKVNRPRYQAIFAAQPEHRSGSTYGPLSSFSRTAGWFSGGLRRQRKGASVVARLAKLRPNQTLKRYSENGDGRPLRENSAMGSARS
jgi:hypothetical protein